MKRKVILTRAIVEMIIGKTAKEIKTCIGGISDTDYSEYADVMEYMMVNGEMPSGDYFYSSPGKVGCDIEYVVSDECSEKLADAAKHALSYEDFLEKMYHIPFYRLHEEFSNCFKLTAKEVSKKEVIKEFGGKISYDSPVLVNRPRYFLAKCDGETFYMVQPDRRKAEFTVVRQYFRRSSINGRLNKSYKSGTN